MKETKETKILNLNLDNNKRMIFVADIHGDINTLDTGLKKIGFNDNDYLFIIGDIIEKGDETFNLKTLRYVMSLAKKPNVYVLAGNCDEVFRFIIPNDEITKQRTLYYINERKHSILNDIAIEQNFKLGNDMDIDAFKNMVFDKYNDLIEFIDSLYDVIFINDELVLVHAGIDDIDDIPTTAIKVLKYDRFYELSKPQKKLMIVGHYPTRNYRADVSCVNPIFDFRKNIISIDGGNHLVKGGQINFVILESLSSMDFTYQAFDHYPKYVMKRNVLYDNPHMKVNLRYGDNEIEIIDKDLDFYLVKHVGTNLKMWVPQVYVYQDLKTAKYYTYDATNQFLTVNQGDVISVIKKANPYSVIKHDGFIGLINTEYIDED